MTAHILCVLPPVDQEKLTAPMSDFDSLTEALVPMEKQKAKWPGDRGKRHIDLPPHPLAQF